MYLSVLDSILNNIFTCHKDMNSIIAKQIHFIINYYMHFAKKKNISSVLCMKDP